MVKRNFVIGTLLIIVKFTLGSFQRLNVGYPARGP